MLKLRRVCDTRYFVLGGRTWVRSESDQPKDDTYIWVGPPHSVSNLRPTVFPKNENLTTSEKKYHAAHLETQSWNQRYWEIHNSEFEKAKTAYINDLKQQKQPSTENIALTTEELSSFYKGFLDKNHKKHMQYNWEWYKRNFYLLYLALKANISRTLNFPFTRKN